MLKLLPLLFAAVLFTGCLQNGKPPRVRTDAAEEPGKGEMEEERARLLETDRTFSNLSAAKGYKAAFLDYIDSNGVLLRPDMAPIIGADAIDYLSQQSDDSFTMTWDPRGGSVARSGDMGYTYGLYSIKPNAQDTVIYGTYVNVWKKQADGTWKFVLDSGNEGLEP